MNNKLKWFITAASIIGVTAMPSMFTGRQSIPLTTHGTAYAETHSAVQKTEMDKYVEQTLKLVPLVLPEEDVLPDREAVRALKDALVVRVDLPNSKFGPGTIMVAFESKKRRALYMAVSPSMLERGMKRTQVLDDGLRMYSKCWSLPTTAGVAGCVLETFTKWVFKT